MYSYSSYFNVVITKDKNNFESASYNIIKDNPEWDILESYCEKDLEESDIYLGKTAEQTTNCYEKQERNVTTKKVFENGAEKILSVDYESKDYLTSTSTVTIDGTHVEESCDGILNFNPDFQGQDGNYPALVGGSYSMTLICDMTTDGGGWTKVSNVNAMANVVESTELLSTSHLLGSNSSSMAARYFNLSNPKAIMFVNKAETDARGYNDLVIVERNNEEWGWTVSNYNNNTGQTGKFYDSSSNTWSNIGTLTYASHEGATWQNTSFSFTRNNILNGYRSELSNRVILGPTFMESADSYRWHNFYGNDESFANTWADSGAAGEVWMR